MSAGSGTGSTESTDMGSLGSGMDTARLGRLLFLHVWFAVRQPADRHRLGRFGQLVRYDGMRQGYVGCGRRDRCHRHIDGSAGSASGDTSSSGAPGRTNDTRLVAVVTGLFGYCAGDPLAKMDEAMESVGRSAQNASRSSN